MERPPKFIKDRKLFSRKWWNMIAIIWAMYGGLHVIVRPNDDPAYYAGWFLLGASVALLTWERE